MTPKKTERFNDATRRPTPAEYRAARRRAQREATRAVKRTLIAIALFAGLYYLYLASTSRPEPPSVAPETSRATGEIENAPPTPNAENAASEAPATP